MILALQAVSCFFSTQRRRGVMILEFLVLQVMP